MFSCRGLLRCGVVVRRGNKMERDERWGCVEEDRPDGGTGTQ